MREKSRALYSEYLKGLGGGQFTSMRDACRQIACRKAPHFFIDPKRASDYIGSLLAGGELSGLSELQAKKIRRLYDDYLEYIREHPGTQLSRLQVMVILVDRPAPEFFMTPDAVRRVLRKEIRNARARCGW